MKKKTRPTRKTLAKIIEAQPDVGKTGLATLYGRQLSTLEACCHTFLHTHSHLADIDETSNELSSILGIEGTDKKLLLKHFADIKILLSIELLQAILNRDGKAIRSLAKFVEDWTFLKTPEDIARWEILLLKKRCELGSKKMTVKQVAQYLNRVYGRNYPTQSPDGLASLRRLCKSLSFSIAPDSKGRPRKTVTRKA